MLEKPQFHSMQVDPRVEPGYWRARGGHKNESSCKIAHDITNDNDNTKDAPMRDGGVFLARIIGYI